MEWKLQYQNVFLFTKQISFILNFIEKSYKKCKMFLGQNTVVKFSVEYVIVICNDDLR